MILSISVYLASFNVLEMDKRKKRVSSNSSIYLPAKALFEVQSIATPAYVYSTVQLDKVLSQLVVKAT